MPEKFEGEMGTKDWPGGRVHGMMVVVKTVLSRMWCYAAATGILAAGCAKKEETTGTAAAPAPTTSEVTQVEARKELVLQESATDTPPEAGPVTNVAESAVEPAPAEAERPEPVYPAQEVFEEALVLLRSASDANGRGEAMELIRKAAEAGNPRAQHALGVSYLAGIVLPKSAEEGLEWLNKSAAAGYAEAQFKMASLYIGGDVVAADEAKALEFARRAAEQGHREAQYNLGTVYATGRGVEKDVAKAAEWFRKAAENGHATAQSNLGVLYASGEVFEKNPEEALKWWRKAAEQGQPSAQFNLGQMLLEGKTAEKDLVEAYKWFSLAAEQGDRDARRMRDSLAVELEPAQVGDGLKRAREFKTELRARLREEAERLL